MKHPDFAERFRHAVAASGINNTQKHLSKVLGVSEVMIWSYRNGEKLPRMKTAVHMAKTFGVSLEWLLQGVHRVAEPPPLYDTAAVKEILTLVKSLSPEDQQAALALLQEKFS